MSAQSDDIVVSIRNLSQNNSLAFELYLLTSDVFEYTYLFVSLEETPQKHAKMRTKCSQGDRLVN